jgi:lipopolysaccharide transport system permease protein
MRQTDKHRLMKDVVKAFGLWRVWVFLGIRDVRIRYRRSFFGPAWILINSIVFVAAVGGVYGLLFNQTLSEFLPKLMAGFVVWVFINSTLIDGGTAFINAEGYIKQFAYPKQVYILRSWLNHLIVFTTSFFALLCLLLYLDKLSLAAIFYTLPGLTMLLIAGLLHTLNSAYLTVRFRDLPHILASGLQILFYVTPVIYPASMLEDRGFAFIYEVNPFYHLINVVKTPLLQQSPAAETSYWFLAGYLSILIVTSYLVMRRTDAKVVFWL